MLLPKPIPVPRQKIFPQFPNRIILRGRQPVRQPVEILRSSHNSRKRKGPQQQGQPPQVQPKQGDGEHTKNRRASTKNKHQEGQARRQRDQKRAQGRKR